MEIKKRIMKPSARGLYIQDKELLDTVFQPKTNFTFEVDAVNKLITIKPSESSNNTVSKRLMTNGKVKPVIDIRDKRVKELLSKADKLEILIEQDRIYISIGDNNTYELPKDQIPQTFKVSDSKYEPLQIAMDVLALFSGSGLLDLGFSNEGFEIKLAIEKDVAASNTYLLNHNTNMFVGDIREIPKHTLPKTSVVIGGTPCQSFSNANRKDRIIDHPNNMLVLEFIETVRANENCKIFVMENVPEMLTCGDGRFLDEIKSELSEFEVTSGVLNAADYGDAQERRRAFIIGSKLGEINLPSPNESPYKTVQDAFEGITSDLYNQSDITVGKEETVNRMSFVKQGGNWRDIPKQFLPKNFGKNTHSNIYKRLAWNKPSITLPNVRKSNILHPVENRILSVRECARLFSLPDAFHFVGNLSEKQQQICNGVPLKLATAVANLVKETIQKFNNSQTLYC